MTYAAHPLAAAALAAAFAALASDSAAPVKGQAPGQPARDGRWLYARNCESCHGANGDGRGTLSLQMGKPARSFADGGFAFGNTREALFRTVTAGMPGSIMPGFKGTLTEEERWTVVDWVRANLMPPQPPEEVAGRVVRVTREPSIVRGYLPPITDGAPMRPRGLLLGTPEGLTFEYRTDDVRLLGVRYGDFVDRTDWNGRGGSPLKPLGQVMQLVGGGDPGPTFEVARGDEWTPAHARLLATWVRDDAAGLRYELVEDGRPVAALVEESYRVHGLSIGPAYTRRFALHAHGAGRVALLLAQWREEPRGFGSTGGTWFVAETGEKSFEHLHVRAAPGSQLVDSNGLRIVLELAPDAQVAVELTYFTTADFSEDRLETLADEIGR